jgi:hypothetical protein
VTFSALGGGSFDPQSFGASVISAGDLNGDGYADVAIGAKTTSLLVPWRVYVYFGGAAGPATTASVILDAPVYAGTRGPELSAAGDVNGDGFDDLLVGSPELLFGAPTLQPLLARAALYHGAATGPASVPTHTFLLPSNVSDFGGTFGHVVGGVGDIDRDGFADIVVGMGQRIASTFPYAVTQDSMDVHQGGSTGTSPFPSVTLSSAPSQTRFQEGLARLF